MVENCKKQLSLHSLKETGESASADHVAGAKYHTEFQEDNWGEGLLIAASL
jgi:hypothetical protein